ncbi:gamma-glutamyltransferase [Thiomicrorhabdus sp.]|uniref:gamma-glutamyltransferase n=1 Tax=Thiomicrorhabdus sp. TaxID=2039724 RepID=UPI0029C70306|nr:gamma-glutamyltransferase [Thiomicrorhabdus sp.]
MRIYLSVLLIGWLSLQFTPVYASQAAVAMPDRYGAEVAEKILHQGGNAVDAAVAAGFALAVTYPEAGNLGGGGFMTLFIGEKKATPPQAHFLDYRETAPGSSSRDMYLDAEGEVIPFASLIGAKASGVPGTVMGFWQAHQRFGRLSWETVLQPAIELAKNGFVVAPSLEDRRRWYQSWIAGKSDEKLNFDAYFGELKSGERFRQPELAQTLKRIARQGAEDFYHGRTAELIVKTMQMQKGLISRQDLAGYRVKWRAPIRFDWNGYTVLSAPPPSSGGIALGQLLQMHDLLKNQYRQAQEKAKTGNQLLDSMALKTHFFAEMEKRVYADRAEYLGDSDFVDVPVERLLSREYLQKRAASVNFQAISDSEKVRPGLAESPETTHFSIVDSEGNAVSNTYTLNMPFGNGVVIEGAGFLMNDEMDDFSTKPGVANVFGVTGGQANEIVPGKRMLSSMSPTLVLDNGQVKAVVGTPGGSTIITSVFQVILNVLDRDIGKGMGAQNAVDAIRVHHQLWPKNRIDYHPELAPETQKALTALGYRLRRNDYLGDVQLLVRQSGVWQAAADYRGRGVAKVFSVSDSPVPIVPAQNKSMH